MKNGSGRHNETKLRMIRVAADLFHKQGVVSTSPEEILEGSGTGKGQFYHYFGSKAGLVHEVLQAHLEAIRSGAARIRGAGLAARMCSKGVSAVSARTDPPCDPPRLSAPAGESANRR
jgi:AcrR family transcriptional regulator